MFGETATHDQLIYDFYGFPETLYKLQYPAPGAPWLTDVVQEVLGETIPQRSRGLDHGVWIPFLHMWPDANVPILQLSLPSGFSNQQLFELGQRMIPLREKGVAIVGCGTLSHNLNEGLRIGYTSTPDWVKAFDQWTTQALEQDRERLLQWEIEAPYAERNHPTPEHFRPLLITAGAATEQDALAYPIEGFDMGVFSKRSVQFYIT